MPCPRPQQQLVPATSPGTLGVRMFPPGADSAGTAGANRLLYRQSCARPAASQFPVGAPSSPGPHFPARAGVTSLGPHAGGGMGPPQRCSPGAAPAVPCGGQSGNRGLHRPHPARPGPPAPAGPKRAISAPEVPKAQVKEVERFRMISDGKFPTCCTLEAALTELSPSCRRDGEAGDGTGPLPGDSPGGAGGTAGRARPGAAEGRGLRVLHSGGRRGGFALRGLCHPPAPGKSRFSGRSWKQPRPPAEGRRGGIVRESMCIDNIELLIAQITGGLREEDRTIERAAVIGAAPSTCCPAPLGCTGTAGWALQG